MCEALLIRPDERQRITTKIRASLDQLVTKHGYERYTLEAFWEELVELLDTMTQDSLHSTLNEENATSDYATWYFRVHTSAHLKADPWPPHHHHHHPRADRMGMGTERLPRQT